MDKLLAALCVVIVLAIIISGELYLKMDRNKSLALVFLKKMSKGLDSWIAITDNLFEVCSVNADIAKKYSELSSQYHSIKNKHAYKKVPIINQIFELVRHAISENMSDQQIIEFGRELTQTFLDFNNLQVEYNASASNLNNALEKKVSGTIGKVMRMRPLETLVDLSIL